MPAPAQSEAAPLVLKTVSVRVRNRSVSEVDSLLWSLTSPRGTVAFLKSRRALRITDVPWEIDRMVRIVRAVDESSVPDQAIWIFDHMTARPTETGRILNKLFMKEREPGVTLSKIIPVDRKKLLIIVGNEAAARRISQLRPDLPPPLGPSLEPVELPSRPPPGAHL